ncbi:MAG: PHP domain-containing protein [Bacillota bacterium]|jgi:putative hydrolase
MWRVTADYHTHTKYSSHSLAAGSIEDNARSALKAGLDILGIADHGPANWGHWSLTNLTTFEKIMVETKQVEQALSEIKILSGVEANIISYDGDLDIPLTLQRRLDQVLAGFHPTVFPKLYGEGVKYAARLALSGISLGWRQKARNENTKAVIEAVYRNEIDIITHPGHKISIDTPELARACARTDTALEINSKHGAASVGFIKAAALEGVRFAIGSDAHRPQQVGQLYPGVRAAQIAGLRADQIINVCEVPG